MMWVKITHVQWVCCWRRKAYPVLHHGNLRSHISPCDSPVSLQLWCWEGSTRQPHQQGSGLSPRYLQHLARSPQAHSGRKWAVLNFPSPSGEALGKLGPLWCGAHHDSESPSLLKKNERELSLAFQPDTGSLGLGNILTQAFMFACRTWKALVMYNLSLPTARWLKTFFT